MGLGVARLIFQKECKILPWQQIASINTQKSGISIHVALPLFSEKISSNFPQIILSVCKAMTPYPSMVLDWAVGYETCKFAQYKANLYVEGNTTCSDPNNGSGYIVIARRATVGTHTSKTVAKVFNLLIYKNFFQE